MQTPRHYTVLRTTTPIQVDGKDNEPDWQLAPWTEDFSDITTGAAVEEPRRARCKMLWNKESLYVYAEFREQDIWASLTKQDERVFQDNAFEIFINPDGSAFNYFEFQINALAAVWDLFMPRPYRNGGRALSSWDIHGLQKAVRIGGTLNNAADKDSCWSVELAIPFAALDIKDNTISAGTIWRMNFSRVQWQLDVDDGIYKRQTNKFTSKLLPERYSVWSPQGIVNLHYPERWGYVLFADSLPGKGFLSPEKEKLILTLWKYYYLQQQYQQSHEKYAVHIYQLDKLIDGLPDIKASDATIKLLGNEKQFWIEGNLPGLKKPVILDSQGELHIADQ
ncbi:MAG: carbohydrate-binding family 9-like protein [Chitinophagaceae bacterium]|nr:carbohydrate-binding family 9-like protein [Chitinophagaceae bacterium]